ncbi:MAG: class I adenylate-forming enzyme family protein [Thermomicrobiales bacterium]
MSWRVGWNPACADRGDRVTAPHRETIGEAIAYWASVSPDAPAVLAYGLPPLTWADLLDLIHRFTAVLRANGVGPRDRVVLMIPQSRAAEVANPVISAAAVPAPLNPDAPPADLAEIASMLQPKLAIVTAETAHRAAPLGCPAIVMEPELRLPGDDRREIPEPLTSDDYAIVLATSGSTGTPRLAPRTHRQLTASTALWMRHLAFGRDNIGFIVGRPFHALGAMLFRSVIAGSAAVVHIAHDPASAIEPIRALRPTWMLAAPSWYAGMLAAKDAELPPFRMVMSGSAPLPPGMADAISVRFGAPLVCDYGLSEAPCLALTNPRDQPGDAPRYQPLMPDDLGIAGPDGALLPVGSEGEIIARGPIVLPGYLGGSETAFFPGGWLRTGDLGVMDPDGRFRVTGRLKLLINRGGEMISPVEIERVLMAHPAVADAAVVILPHPTLGEDIEALVVLRPGAAATARELRRWMLDRLIATRVPRALTFRDALPLGPTGKLDRRALQAEIFGREHGKTPLS